MHVKIAGATASSCRSTKPVVLKSLGLVPHVFKVDVMIACWLALCEYVCIYVHVCGADFLSCCLCFLLMTSAREWLYTDSSCVPASAVSHMCACTGSVTMCKMGMGDRF